MEFPSLRNVNSNDNGNVNGNDIDDGDRDLFAEALERTVTDTFASTCLSSVSKLSYDHDLVLMLMMPKFVIAMRTIKMPMLMPISQPWKMRKKKIVAVARQVQAKERQSQCTVRGQRININRM